ncbi:membrane protein [Intrasporangium oryzae NRRL B-24470]|uniref:protein-serine/threonine phosphatase n=1 Tax=Intrasporangium oryzae NRRL B-24470 TaxID=1386089 RepID=W9G782_9MICO|nr:SpoIIE family protein phosphatase [Intrasporangium oryzae]EWT02001.1 membrane protein [Intrasporangium oryzae NRRL B-24470]
MTGHAGTPKTTIRDSLRAQPHLLGHVGSLVVVGVGYYLGARLGLGLSLVRDNVTPLWPPTGIAVAAFLVLGRSMWPAVAVAAFAVNLPISASPLAAAVTAVGNTAAPLVAVTLLNRVGFRRQLDRQRDALSIVFLGALASMLVSATIGSATLALTGRIPAGQLPAAFAVWWTGDAMGVLVVAPFLLSIPLFWEQPRWSARHWVEAGALLVLTAVAITWAIRTDLHLLFLTLPIVGWASWRLQLRGAAPAALIASLVATWGAAQELGPFAGRSLLEQMFTLWSFNACVALTSFFLAALVSERMQAADALAASAAELEERVRLRTAELSEANARLLREIRERSEAQEQLSHEEARAQREHQIAETLQRSLLPERMPLIPGVDLAARYVPATADVQVGGDWYDVVQLPGGLIGLAIGDVAGHGLQAAATMAQVRMALRAYAMQDPAPSSVMRGVHRLVAQLPGTEMVTLMYLLFDPVTRQLRFANAGHPPALVFGHGGGAYLRDGLAPPIGVTADATFAEASHALRPGSTLLLYTDGLVERRGVSIADGLERLSAAAVARAGDDLEGLCDGLLSAFLEESHVADDVALLAMRPSSVVGGPFSLSLPAEARMLVQVRETMRRWLRESGVPSKDADEILIACGEACANVVRHAYGAHPGDMGVEARLVDGSVEVLVRDDGAWRPAADRGGGWGLQLMSALMDSVDVEHREGGTDVRMRRRVAVGDRA